MQLKIYHTNDIHSQLENFAKITTFLKEEKIQNDNNCYASLLLDAGDFHDFMRLEINGTKGTAGRYLLEKTQYDAIVVGNNEGFSGIECLEIMANTTTIPMLSCNLFSINGTPIHGLMRSCILTKQGYRFLIIGATPCDYSHNEFFKLMKLNATDALNAIKKEIDNNNNQYDFCILLSHLGFNEDINLAKLNIGIDVIIGGHSHTDMEEAIKIENTIIHQSGSHGNKIGKLSLTIENNNIIDFEGINIESNGYIEDEEILTIIEEQKQIAINNLSTPLYEIKEILWHDIIMENPLTNFICDALYHTYPCDLAIINSGIASCGISNVISKMKLLNLSPSPLNPTLVKIKGENILLALEASLNDSLCLSDGKGAGFRGKYLGKLHVSNNVTINTKENNLIVTINNEPLNKENYYLVATSDYLQRGTGYSSLASDIDVEYKIEYIRDLLETTLNNQELINKAFTTRWKNNI